MTLAVPSSARQSPRRGIGGERPVYAFQRSDGAQGIGYASLRPKSKPVAVTVAAGGVVTFGGASATEIDQILFRDNPIILEMYQNTAQTLLPRLVGSSENLGLEIGLDLVNNETVEYVLGGNHVANPYGYTVGTSKPASLRVTLKIVDVSGSDQLVIGWRKQEAYAAATAPIFLAASDPTYTDFAAIGFAAAGANPAVVRTITDLNDSGVPVVTSTGFTWADGEVHTLEVRLYGRKALYYINGMKLGGRISVDGTGAAMTAEEAVTPPAFSFDTGDFLVPFIFSRFDATAPGAIYVSPAGILPGIEVGPLSEMGLDPANLQALSL